MFLPQGYLLKAKWAKARFTRPTKFTTAKMMVRLEE